MTSPPLVRSGLFIAVEGPTGVGKTTLAGRLADALDAVAMFDPFEANPFLAPLLTADGHNEALALRAELTFLALRVAQLREISVLLSSGRRVVADWALLKQPIFAATTLHEHDVARVAATVLLWGESLPRPHVLIGLSATTAVIQQRVRQRGRIMESQVSGAQLDTLSAAFDAAYANWDRPLIRLSPSNFDTFHDRHVRELADLIRQLPIPLETR